MAQLRVALAQINTVVGDLEANAASVVAEVQRATALGAHLVVFPELTLTGYPPEDLLLKHGFVDDVAAVLAELAHQTGSTMVVVGYVEAIDDERTAADVLAPRHDSLHHLEGTAPRRHLANAAAICQHGQILATIRKQLLPNYGVFDEQRWFDPGAAAPIVLEVEGRRVGFTICEDLWSPDGPARALADAGAEVLCNLNASPYSRNRLGDRHRLVAERATATSTTICYVNQVGGQDELVFDGASFVTGPDGTVLAQAAQFEPELLVVDIGGGPADPEVSSIEPRHAQLLDPLAEVYAALVLGVRDYFRKNRFTDAIIGLSGGIDSSLVAAVAVDALGAEHVHGIALPSRYSSDGSRSDAEDLARRLGIDCAVIAIEPAHQAFTEMLADQLGTPLVGLTDENLQARIRAVTWMAMSNATGAIVLTTGNKSELATGYSTLYGDSAGGFAVIKDVVKTLVYDLCRHRNAVAISRGEVPPISEAVLDKPPSAELRPDQRDDQSLPPYEVLDPIICAYVEDDQTSADLIAQGHDPVLVAKVVGLIDGAEYKRRQSPLGVRITTKAFGRDRRMPITTRYVPRSRG